MPHNRVKMLSGNYHSWIGTNEAVTVSRYNENGLIQRREHFVYKKPQSVALEIPTNT